MLHELHSNSPWGESCPLFVSRVSYSIIASFTVRIREEKGKGVMVYSVYGVWDLLVSMRVVERTFPGWSWSLV